MPSGDPSQRSARDTERAGVGAASIRSLAVVGLGLIGGSVALAARRAYPALRVVGFDPGLAAAEAIDLGLVQRIAPTLEDAVREADLVVLACPVHSMPQAFDTLAHALRDDAIVTDCGSTKDSVIAAARARLGPRFARYLPGHPIAGSERSGPGAARADLFAGKAWLLAPLDPLQQALADRLEPWLSGLGARVEHIDAAIHDPIFGEYSHAAHALVFAMCLASARGPFRGALARMAGAGFRDTTRIGASSPALWAGILADNPSHTLSAIGRVRDALGEFEAALAVGDKDALEALIAEGSRWRALLGA